MWRNFNPKDSICFYIPVICTRWLFEMYYVYIDKWLNSAMQCMLNCTFYLRDLWMFPFFKFIKDDFVVFTLLLLIKTIEVQIEIVIDVLSDEDLFKELCGWFYDVKSLNAFISCIRVFSELDIFFSKMQQWDVKNYHDHYQHC